MENLMKAGDNPYDKGVPPGNPPPPYTFRDERRKCGSVRAVGLRSDAEVQWRRMRINMRWENLKQMIVDPAFLDDWEEQSRNITHFL